MGYKRLLLLEDDAGEELLQLLVGVVDAELRARKEREKHTSEMDT